MENEEKDDPAVALAAAIAGFLVVVAVWCTVGYLRTERPVAVPPAATTQPPDDTGDTGEPTQGNCASSGGCVS